MKNADRGLPKILEDLRTLAKEGPPFSKPAALVKKLVRAKARISPVGTAPEPRL